MVSGSIWVFNGIFNPCSKSYYEFNAKNLLDFFLNESVAIYFGISIVSFITSIIYLNISINSIKKLYKYILYYLIILNKFLIFLLSFICTKLDNENELISNTSFTSIYLYLFELILYFFKKISSLKFLKILQIFSSSIYLTISIILYFVSPCKNDELFHLNFNKAQ